MRDHKKYHRPLYHHNKQRSQNYANEHTLRETTEAEETTRRSLHDTVH